MRVRVRVSYLGDGGQAGVRVRVRDRVRVRVNYLGDGGQAGLPL